MISFIFSDAWGLSMRVSSSSTTTNFIIYLWEALGFSRGRLQVPSASRSSVFFSSNEASVHSPCLRFFLERSLALRCTRWTLHVFHQTPGGESSRSPKLGIYQYLSSGRAFFLEITVPWHLHSESRERYGLEVESRSLLGSYRSYKIPPCFSKR